MRRKVRTDCSYVIYRAICMLTGKSYVGLTRKGSTTPRNATHLRWNKHLSRARCENQDWALYQHLRTVTSTFGHEVLEVVRGRKEAYAREREIVKELKPELNSQYN